MMQIVVFGGC